MLTEKSKEKKREIESRNIHPNFGALRLIRWQFFFPFLGNQLDGPILISQSANYGFILSFFSKRRYTRSWGEQSTVMERPMEISEPRSGAWLVGRTVGPSTGRGTLPLLWLVFFLSASPSPWNLLSSRFSLFLFSHFALRSCCR